MEYKIVRLRECPERKDEAAAWFHEKWGYPLEAYRESMEECLAGGGPVPQWYMAVSEGRIIGGLGVIENDFHDRKDLTPNVCAVYVEEAYRCQGIAGALLDHVCSDMAGLGIGTLYLLTDHTSFYERYGWEFFCMALGDGRTSPAGCTGGPAGRSPLPSNSSIRPFRGGDGAYFSREGKVPKARLGNYVS